VLGCIEGLRSIGVSNTYTAITKRDGDNCQERTREELLETLKVTLKEALEFNRQDAIEAATPDYTEEFLTV